jgi:hypothetical protein
MDWNAIEAISSLIGAVGVIITVTYLAYQIRQNTYSIEGAVLVTDNRLNNIFKKELIYGQLHHRLSRRKQT